jgi:hypothetical protein
MTIKREWREKLCGRNFKNRMDAEADNVETVQKHNSIHPWTLLLMVS